MGRNEPLQTGPQRGEGRKLKLLESIVPEITALEPDMERLSDDELRAQTVDFKQRVDRGEDLDELLAEAFATVREADASGPRPAPFRRPADGRRRAALRLGRRDEDGEGKTLVSTLPAYLNALSGLGVHQVTTNDYLAKRDSEWMGQVHRFLGLEVGVVLPDIDDPALKRQAYAADITFGTNNEYGFDYLRDNMSGSLEEQNQRGTTRDRRRGRLDPHRRGPHATHHLGSGQRRAGAVLPVRAGREDAPARSRLRGRRGEAHDRPTEEGIHASSSRSVSTTSTST